MDPPSSSMGRKQRPPINSPPLASVQEMNATLRVLSPASETNSPSIRPQYPSLSSVTLDPPIVAFSNNTNSTPANPWPLPDPQLLPPPPSTPGATSSITDSPSLSHQESTPEVESKESPEDTESGTEGKRLRERDLTWINWNQKYSQGLFNHSRVVPPYPFGKEEEMPKDFFLRPPPHPTELTRRHSLYRYRILKTTLPRNAFHHLTSLAQRLFGCHMCLVSLIDDDYQWFVSEQGLGCSSTTRGVSFCGHAILSPPSARHEPMVVLDATKDWRFKFNPLVVGAPYIRFYAGANLVDPDTGLPLGTLCIIHREPWESFTELDGKLLCDLADLVVRELRLWREEQWAEVKNEMQKRVAEFTAKTVAAKNSPNEKEGFQMAVDFIQDALSADIVAMIRCSDREDVDDSAPEDCLAVSYQHQKENGQNQDPWSMQFLDKLLNNMSSEGLIWQDNFMEFSEDVAPPILCELGGGKGACSGAVVPVYRVLGERQFTVGGAEQVGMLAKGNGRPFALLGAWWVDKRRIVEEMDRRYLQSFSLSLTALAQRGRVEAANRSKSSFVNSISHELRTPLHGILAVVELLEDTRLSPAQKQFLQTIESCGRSLVSVVNHVLDLAKIEHGRMEVLQVPVDFWRLCEEVCDTMAATVRPGLRFGMRIDGGWDDARFGLSDPGCLRQILINLIGNALKFTEEGEVELQLQIPSHNEEEKFVVFKVVDTGPGMSEQFQARLCLPFSQENPLSGGTGLGLAITRYLVQAMQGEFRVWSRLGEGSRFEVAIPVKPLLQNDPLKTEFCHVKRIPDWPNLQRVLLVCSPRERDLTEQVTRSFLMQLKLPSADAATFMEVLTPAQFLRVKSVVFSLRYDLILVDDDLDALKHALKLCKGFHRLIMMAGISSCFDQASKLLEVAQQQQPYIATALMAKPIGPARLCQQMKCLYEQEQTFYNQEAVCSNVLAKPALTHSVIPASPAFTPTVPLETRTFKEMGVQTNAQNVLELNLNSNLPVMIYLNTNNPPPACTPITELPDIAKISAPLEKTPVVASTPIASTPVWEELGEKSQYFPAAPKPRVLIVEDNPVNRNILATLLKKMGLEFDQAVDGQDGLEQYQRQHYELVLMDIQMPRMDGNEATIEMRKVEAERKAATKTYIWALTGLASSADEQLVKSSGADDVLTKPVRMKKLQEMLYDRWPQIAKPPPTSGKQ